MLAFRRSAKALSPALSRQCAFLTKMKAMEAETTKLAPTLPDGLKEIAESGVRVRLRIRTRPLFFFAGAVR